MADIVLSRTEAPEEPVAETLFRSDAAAAAAAQLTIIDASSNLRQKVSCLRGKGVRTIIRYYSRTSSSSGKVIGKAEADTLINAQFALAIVHENRGSDPATFSFDSGKLDGAFARRYASQTIGQPAGTAIYFAVDFDAQQADIRNRILPYFRGVVEAFGASGPLPNYTVGVYGSGLVCKTILDAGLARLAWLAQSTGWTGYNSFKDSGRWALLQHREVGLCGVSVDFDEANPDSPDFGSFDHLDEPQPQLAAAEAAGEAAMDAQAEITSAKELDKLVPEFRDRVVTLLSRCLARGVKMVPSNGLRDPWYQARLWRQSRSTSQINAAVDKLKSSGAPFLAGVLAGVQPSNGPHVTNALPGLSWHQWGEALDCYWEVNGKAVWDPDAEVNGVKGYHVYVEEAAASGLTAGGSWTSFKDWPHVQLRKAANPLGVMSLAQVDSAMRERFGQRLDVEEAALALALPQTDAQAASGENVDQVLASSLKALVDAASRICSVMESRSSLD